MYHVAGIRIVVASDGIERGIQRCAICGLKLVDTLGQMAVMNPDGSPPAILFWEPNTLVEVIEGNPTSYSAVVWQGNRLPEDTCLSLIED